MAEPPGLTRSPAPEGGRSFAYLKAWIAARGAADGDLGQGRREDLEHFLRHVFDKSKDGISIHDLDFTIVGVNATMQDWYGPGRTLVGRKCHEAYHGRDRPCERCPFEAAVRTGRPQIGVVPYQVSGRNLGAQELSVFPLLDDARRVLCGLEYVRDITPLQPDVRHLERLRRRVQLQEHTLREQETALAVLLRMAPELERRIADEIAEGLDALVMPVVARLKVRCAGTELAGEVALLEQGLCEVASRDSRRLARALHGLTAREQEVATLVRHGRTSKEISALLRISAKSVDFHRTNIRRKLGQGRAGGSLQTLLQDLEHPRSSPE
ncbi:MAG TPA: PAS domain-containing protein [Anaeromyxobacter sp.]|nr:PAS domain-containing protein [Anaeromyxobacter sp.]